MQLWVLVKNDFKESILDYKILWLSLFFVLLGVSQPLILKNMDQLISNFSDTQGIKIAAKSLNPSPNEVFFSTFSGEFNQIGLLVLIMSFLNIVVSEKNGELLDLIFVRDISPFKYMSAKFISTSIVCYISIFIGMLASYIITYANFGYFSLFRFMEFSLLFAIWIAYIISITLLLSSFLNNYFIVGVITIVLAIIVNISFTGNVIIDFLIPSGYSHEIFNILNNKNFNYFLIVSPLFWILINLFVGSKLVKG